MRFMGVVLALTVAAGASAQDLQVADASAMRGPRFLLATARRGEPVRVDVKRTPVLSRRISLELRDVSLEEALAAITERAGLKLSYSTGVIAPEKMERRVRLVAESITVAGAMSEVLFDADVDVLFTSSGQAVLVTRKGESEPVPMVGTVSGTVTEAATGNPVAQAQVSVSGTSRGATTGQDGRYSIAGVPAGARTVSVRRLGFDPQSREVNVPDGESVTADFVLQGARTRLADIVTTATGAQRRVEVGNVVAAINADSLVRRGGITTFGSLLEGRSPGVLSISESNVSGRAGRIRIRGLNSALLSNEPVVVMDGLRVEATSGGAASNVVAAAGQSTSASSGGYTGRLSDINPEEIESIEIVKGPSASTLYGTDAANGVIVITTKRGRAGAQRWVWTSEAGALDQRLDHDDQFPTAYYAFGRNSVTNAQQRCTLLQSAANTCVIDSVRSFNVFDDPATRPFRTSGRQQHSVQISGGAASGATYFLSTDYERETGTYFMPVIDQALVRAQRGITAVPNEQVRPNAGSRVNIRANVTTPLGRRASATISSSYITNKSRQTVGSLLPTFQSGYRDGNDGWFLSGVSNARPAFTFATGGGDDAKRFLASIAATHATRDWLTLRGTVGADLSSDAFGSLVRRGEILGAAATGERIANDLSIARYTIDIGGTAQRNWSDRVTGRSSAGVQYNRREQRGSFIRVRNLPLGGETIAGGTISTLSGSLQEATLTTALAGAYLEQNVGLDDRFYGSVALRFDGGSAFGEQFSVATYPKASISWVAIDGGDKGVRGINSLRLRAAYGASGVQPGPTDALSRIVVSNGLNVAGTAGGPVGTLVAGNSRLRPERSAELEAGFDAELLANRLRIEATVYEKATHDAIVSRLNAPSVGGSLRENIGSVQNQGLELSVSGDVLTSRAVSATITATGFLNRNELTKLGEGVLASSPTSELIRQDEGYPLFGLWGFTVASYADANGNGILESSELVLTGPNTSYIGPNFPTREATVSPVIRLLGNAVHVSALVHYRGGFYRSNLCSTAGARAENDPATSIEDQISCVAIRSGIRRGPSIADASYMVLREVSASVTLPQRVRRAIHASDGTLVLAGRNIAALWKADRVPIETAGSSTDGTSTVQVGAAGSPTYLLARLTLSF